MLEEHAEARQAQLMDEYDATLLQERHVAQAAAEAAQIELRSMSMQQFLTNKKLEHHAREKEAREGAIRQQEARAEGPALVAAALMHVAAALMWYDLAYRRTPRIRRRRCRS